jgi:hypothetical protein
MTAVLTLNMFGQLFILEKADLEIGLQYLAVVVFDTTQPMTIISHVDIKITICARGLWRSN